MTVKPDALDALRRKLTEGALPRRRCAHCGEAGHRYPECEKLHRAQHQLDAESGFHRTPLVAEMGGRAFTVDGENHSSYRAMIGLYTMLTSEQRAFLRRMDLGEEATFYLFGLRAIRVRRVR